MTMFFAVQFWMMAAPDSALPEKPVRPPISMAPSFARIATSSSELSVRWSVLMTQPARPPRSLTPVSFAISPDAVTVPPVAWQFSTSVPSSPPMRTPAHWAKMSLEPVSATIAAPSQFLMSFPLMAPTRPPTIVAAAIRLFSPERSTSSMTASPGDIASKGTGFKAACHCGIRDLKVRRKCIPGDHAKEPGAIGTGVLDAGKACFRMALPIESSREGCRLAGVLLILLSRRKGQSLQYRGGRCPRSGQSFRPGSVGWQRAATPSQSAREPRRFRFPLHSVKSLPHRPGQNTRVPSAACLQTEVTLQAYCCALFSFAASSQWMRSDLLSMAR